MVTSVEQAAELAAQAPAAPMAQANVYVKTATAPQPKPETKPAPAALAGINPQDFITANRIHVKDGSLFIDPYLALHPRELDPKNEALLRKKLQLTYSINNPTFFDSKKRMAIALNLGQLVPISTGAKRSQLMEEVHKFNSQLESGKDTELHKEFERKAAPFASIVRGVTEHPGTDPVGMELLKNSLAIYLLVRERLTQNGYLNPLTDYVERVSAPEQVMADLSSKIGVSPAALREAALKGGVDGVGKLLGLDPRYTADVKALTEYASTQDFGHNIVEHWHLGRQLQGIEAPLKEKLTVGIDARITAKIAEYRDRIRHRYEVPEPVKKEQQRIAESLNLVEPVQRALMFKLGYELCYSPEVNADAIAFHQGIYGLHRKAASDLRDVRGTYRIYFSGHGDLKASMRTMVHEIAHNLWPEQFSAAEVAKIDALAVSDRERFSRFQKLMETQYDAFEKLFNAYRVGNEREKAAIIATTNERFAAFGFRAEGLFPYLREARDFQFAVRHAYDTLSIEGDRYNRSNYNSPEERFREVISRFAELKQVEYRGEPQFLQFLAPGLNQIWENHYIPHLSRVYQGIDSGAIPFTRQPVALADTNENAEVNARVKEEKKVEQRPVVESADAIVDGPLNTVDAQTITPNERVLSAMNTLTSMGAHPQL